jgi:3-hydroxybutyryl-CoA dehydratase
VTGDRFVTQSRTISEEDIASFAQLTGDMHPQHTDAEWAAGSRFGERIAHGLLVQACAVGLMQFDPERVVALRRVGDAVFKLPVKIGDSIHVEGQIIGGRELDDETELVGHRWRVLNQDGRMVLRMNVEVVCRRAPVLASRDPSATGDRSAGAGTATPAPDSGAL